jgi:arsenate reductase
MTGTKPVVLFLCLTNSCRSQMAEALLRRRAGDQFEVVSAGIHPAAEIHPLTRAVMAEVGCDLTGQRPKGVRESLGALLPTYVIVLCDGVSSSCPAISPGPVRMLRWPFEDPAEFEGPPEAQLAKFREVRDLIDGRIRAWLDALARTDADDAGQAQQEDAASPGRRLKVLFLCTGNSCRSQMAEGWARHLKGAVVVPFSAGLDPHGLDPRAVRVMGEAGVDISRQRSKSLNEFRGQALDYVVTVCDHAHEACPVFPGATRNVHVGFDDPPRLAQGAKNEEEALAYYRRVRDEIRAFVEGLPESLTAPGRSTQPVEEDGR